MAIDTVSSTDLGTTHLGKLTALHDTAQGQRCLIVGPLVSIVHRFDAQGIAVVDIEVAIGGGPAIEERLRDEPVDLGDDFNELLKHVASD